MASWQTSNVQTDFDAQSYTNSVRETRDTSRSASNGGGLKSSDQYSIVGMNASKAGEAAEAIDTYVAMIQSKIAEIDARTPSLTAFKAETEDINTAVSNYMEKVKEYASNLASNLKAFSDKLMDAKAAWNASVTAASETIDSDVSNFDAVKEYARQK